MSLGLTLGARSRLVSELLHLRSSNPPAVRQRLKALGVSTDQRQKLEEALCLEERSGDVEKLVPAKMSVHDSGFARYTGVASAGKAKPLRILCLHGFASNNLITKMQLECGLGMLSVLGVQWDVLRSTIQTVVRDDTAQQDAAPSASTALVVKVCPLPSTGCGIASFSIALQRPVPALHASFCCAVCLAAYVFPA